MSEVFVARQPIFDRALVASAYELLFRGSNNIDRALVADHDEATSTVVLNALTEFGIDGLVSDGRAWVNVSRDFVVAGLARALPPDRVVLELLEDQGADEELLAALAELRRDGYVIALDDFDWSAERSPALDYADVVKIDVLNRDHADVVADVELVRPHGVTLLAEKVETRDDYARCTELGFELFQGYFFCKPETMSARGVAPNRAALLQLVAALQDPDIAFGELERLISHDVALSYRLLRYINSAFFGLRREVDSIGRALALLGLENVKRWSTLSAFAGIDEKPREVVVTGLVRARFCELAGPELAPAVAPERLFTLGLFSVVDALLDAPIAEVMARIPVPPAMVAALVERAGPKGELLNAALRCERGEFPSATLAAVHVEAMRWASDAAAQLFERQPAARATA